MVGVPGVAEKLFAALRAEGVSVVVISQASSEHSICFAVPDDDADRARAVVEAAFAGVKGMGVAVERGCAVLAAVGDGMAQRAGVAGKFFSALGDVGVSVKAVAQGSSERNVTAVIAGADSTRALRAVHNRFTLAKTTLSLGLVGPGLIGSALLAQLEAQREMLRARFHVDLRVVAVASRRGMSLRGEGEDVDVALDWDRFVDRVRPSHAPHAVIVDCSASDDVADRYAGWLRRGIHVVTPNKRAASGPLVRWQSIVDAVRHGPARYYGEATVGAGLPVVATLKELLLTGDDVSAVEGVLSGTLSWIFNTWQPGEAFSQKVREARAKGFTEPDPREDLSGLDFARKLVVLAREMGRAVSLDDVDVEDLAPGLAFGQPLEALLGGMTAVDVALAARQRAAHDEGKVLRMVGAVPEQGRLRVSLQALPATHPFSRLDGTDNMLCFRTRRYADRPLVVQGPGAGAEVTAGGVFGDLLRIAARLGGDV
jgi:aspartokinase/homoserine dehydrogenase 1